MVIFSLNYKENCKSKQYNAIQCFFPIERQFFFFIENIAHRNKKKDNYSFRYKTSDSNSRIYFSLRSDKNK